MRKEMDGLVFICPLTPDFLLCNFIVKVFSPDLYFNFDCKKRFCSPPSNRFEKEKKILRIKVPFTYASNQSLLSLKLTVFKQVFLSPKFKQTLKMKSCFKSTVFICFHLNERGHSKTKAAVNRTFKTSIPGRACQRTESFLKSEKNTKHKFQKKLEVH